MRPCIPTPIIAVLAGFATALFPSIVSAQPAADLLAESFRNPPDAARPRTWWHWTMSNMSKVGITKDLEWMKRVGIGGFMWAM